MSITKNKNINRYNIIAACILIFGFGTEFTIFFLTLTQLPTYFEFINTIVDSRTLIMFYLSIVSTLTIISVLSLTLKEYKSKQQYKYLFILMLSFVLLITSIYPFITKNLDYMEISTNLMTYNAFLLLLFEISSNNNNNNK